MPGDCTVTLELPDPQFYITVAILVAIAAIVTTYTRENDNLRLPRPHVNRIALILLLTTAAGVVQIILSIIVKNDYSALPTAAAVDYIVHSIILTVLLLLLFFWYWGIAIYRETPAAQPTNPAADP